MLLRYIYTAFLGLLIAVFIGVGVSVFYEQPESPTCYEEITYSDSKEPTNADRQAETQCQQQWTTWEEETMGPYNRNVSIITMVFAVGLVALGLSLESKNKVIADGVMLGGVFTLLYSVGRGFASMNTKYSFAIITVGLIVALLIGFKRFVEPHEKEVKKKSE